MSVAISLLPRMEAGADCPTAAVLRAMILDAARTPGETPLAFPGLSVFRFDEPGTLNNTTMPGTAFCAVLQGAKEVRVGGERHLVRAGRLVVVTRPCAYGISVVEATRQRPYLGIGLSFSPERVARALLTLAEAGPAAAVQERGSAFLLDCDPGIAGALERLVGMLADPIEAKLLGPLIVDEILLRLLRTNAAAALRASVGSAGDVERVLRAMQLIRDNHAEKLSVDEIARQVAMSPSHFAHRFRAVARVSPMRYLRQVRLELARERLLGGARVSEAAMEVGFQSPAHFTREFKRLFGVSPSGASAGL